MEAQALYDRIFRVALFMLLITMFSCGQSKIMHESRKKNSKKVYACKHIGRQKHMIKKINEKEFASVRLESNSQVVIPKEFYLPKVEPNTKPYEIEFVIEDQATKGENEIIVPKEFYLPKVDPNDTYEFEFISEVKTVENEMTPEIALPLPQPVYFRFDTDILTHNDIHQIVLAVEHIKLGKNVILEGHTDSHGSKEYNRTLSLKRANMIKNMMIDLGGVSTDVVSVMYYGEEKQAVPNDSDSNRQLNRRVEFIVQQ